MLAMSLDRRLHVDADITASVALDVSAATVTVDWAGTAPPIGGGTEATALRVTVASDSTGVLTVDGTVTATGPLTDTELRAASVVVDLGTDNDVTTTADATDGGAHGASQTGFRVLGTDGTNDQQISVDATGNVQVDIVADAAGLATSAGQLADGHNVTVDNASIAVTGPLTDTELRAATVVVDLGDDNDVTLATLPDTAAGDLAAMVVSLAAIDNPVGVLGTTTYLEGSRSAFAIAAVRNDVLATLASVDNEYAPLQVNASGSLYVTGGGAGTDYTLGSDVYAELTTIGSIAAVVRFDAGGSLVDTDNEVTALQVNSAGALRVTGGGGGQEYVQDAVVTDPATAATFLLARDDSLTTQETADNDWTVPRANARGAQWVELDPTNAIDVSAATVTVTDDGSFTLAANSGVDIGDVDILSIVPGVGATNLGKEVGLQAASGDVGVLALAIRDDELATLPHIEADFIHIRVNEFGALWTTGGTAVEDLAAADDPIGSSMMVVREDARAGSITGTDGDNIALRGNNSGELYTLDTDAVALLTAIDLDTSNITACDTGAVVIASGTVTTVSTVTSVTDIANTVTVDGTGTFLIQEDGPALTALALIDNPIVAHGDAVSGSTGVSIGGLEARSTEPTAVADAEATRGISTVLGKQVTIPYSIPNSTWRYAAASGGITDTSGVTAKAAAGANIINYITRCQIINGDTTTGTDVQIRDGAAGTVMWRGWAESSGGGASVIFDPPLRGTANTLVEVACGTTGSTTYFNLQGYVALE